MKKFIVSLVYTLFADLMSEISESACDRAPHEAGTQR